MVSLGMLMLLLALTGVWLRKTGKLFESKWFHRFALFMGPSGFIAYWRVGLPQKLVVNLGWSMV
jgi:cytochrome bd-type quinol oxidase subunit 1